MATERYVALGLARARARWFSDVARWATSGAVLIMALLGAAMWVTFDSIWSDTAQNTEDQVEIIGSDGSAG